MKRILTGIILAVSIFTANGQTTNTLTFLRADLSTSHYVSGKDTSLAQRFSKSNPDSAFFPLYGYPGTVNADSLGDSIFVLYNLLPTVGGVMSVGVAYDYASDTLCDSIIVYENRVPLSPRYSMKALTSTYQGLFAFTVSPSANSYVSRPELITIKTKWKKLAGKALHYLRFRPNFITGQQ